MESAALHAAIDVMLQRSVIALVDQQKNQLRAAAETELKFLSFLSHDLNNNLNSVTLTLQILRLDLNRAVVPRSGRVAGPRSNASMTRSWGCVEYWTTNNSEIRQSDNAVARRFTCTGDKNTRGILAARLTPKGARRLIVEIRPGTVVESDGELLTLVLQNLVGNAVKYISRGDIRVAFS